MSVDELIQKARPKASVRLKGPVRLKMVVFVFSGILAVIPVVLFGISQAMNWRSQHIESFEKKALRRTEIISHEVAEVFQYKRRVLEALALSINDLGLERSPKLNGILSKYKSRFWFRSLYLVDAHGDALSSGSAGEHHYVGEDPDFRELVQTGRSVTSNALIARDSSTPVIRILVPIYDAQGKVKLVLCSSLNVSELQNAIRQVMPSELQFDAMVLDEQKRVLVSTGPASRSVLSTLAANHPLRSVVHSAKSGASSVVFHGLDEQGTEIHGVANQMTEGVKSWTVALSVPYASLIVDAKRSAMEMLRFCLLALLISLAVGYFVALQASLPLSELANALLTVEETNLDQPIVLRRKLYTVEMVELKIAFNRMRAKLHDYTLNLEKTIAERTQLIEAQREQIEYSGKMAALGEMAGGVAHEVNNPLAIVCAYAERLIQMSQTGTLDPETVSQMAKKINDTSYRIVKIVKCLRSFARDGKRDPFEATSVESIVLDTVEFCQAKLRNGSVDLQIAPITAECKIECQAVQISQVLLNLLNNACDAIQGQEKKWIRIEVVESGHEIRLMVTDSGAGVPHELRDKIMRPFFTTKEVGKGTGLGLSISLGIAAAHGGKLYLDELAQNTRFVICLPKSQRSGARASAA